MKIKTKFLLLNLLFLFLCFELCAQQPKILIKKDYYISKSILNYTKKNKLLIEDTVVQAEYQYYLKVDTMVKHGFYKKYNNHKKIEIIGFFNHGKKDSIWKYYNNENKLTRIINYENGNEVGKGYEFYEKNIVFREWNYNKNSILDGEYNLYYPSGVNAIKINYINGIIDGYLQYFYENGNLIYDAKYSNGEIKDTIYSYFPDGSLMGKKVSEYTIVYNEDSSKYMEKIYKDSIYTITYYYNNGKTRAKYIEKNTMMISVQYFSTDGVILDTGTYYSGNGLMKIYDGNDLYNTTQYKNNKKEGLKTYFYKNGNKSVEILYNNDTTVTGMSRNYLQNGTLESIGKTKIEFIREKDYAHIYENTVPEFLGENSALLKYLSNNIKYPELSRENEIEGKVIIKFYIDTLGKAQDLKILKNTADEKCGEEALRVVKEMPNWLPGFSFGFPQKVYYTLPISFKLH